MTVHAQERIKLIKVESNSTVYFVDKQNIRHAFPSREVYESWYGSDFANVMTVSKEYLASLRLGPNVTWKPGKALLNVPFSKEVYAVEPGGVLRAIKNEETAMMIFGERWYERIRALPEIFFQNYVVGQPITDHGDVPDGWVVKELSSEGKRENLKMLTLPTQAIASIGSVRSHDGAAQRSEGDERYYVKWRGVLQKFDSLEVMRRNGYSPEDVLDSLSNYFAKRVLELKNIEDRISDPTFIPNVSSRSCDLSDLRIGIVVIADRTLTKDEFGVLQDSVEKLSAYYDQATEGLGKVEAENNILVMNFNKVFDDPIQRNINFEEVARTYFDFHEDDVDFLAVFNTVYQHNENEIARYIPVTNSIVGTGKLIYNRANQFGSMGRLKGVFDMGNIAQFAGEVGNGPNLTLATLVHEMMHSVSGSIEFLDENGRPNDMLLGYNDPFHWSRFLLETSLLGGDGWAAEGGGRPGDALDTTQDTDVRGLTPSFSVTGADGSKIYKSEVSSDTEFRRKFSDLDLYAFGFIPARSVRPIQYLEVTDRSNPAHRVEGTIKKVSIDQIVSLNGKRQCRVE